MNMTLSKRGDYVMRAAIALARAFDSGTPRKIREVVADTEMPQTFASQILADLVRGGLAQSKAGRDGGYWLVRPPTEISVLEVIEAAEGPLRAERCALGDDRCNWEAVCPLHETWTAATAALSDLLANTSLAEVAARDAAIEAGTYSAPLDSHRSHASSVAVDDRVQVELGREAARLALGRQRGQLADVVQAALGTEAQPEATTGRRRPGRVECSLEAVGGRRSASDRYLLAWRVAGVDVGTTDTFEGELSLTSVDDERSELQVSGTWHHRPDPADPLPTAELERQARRALRSFLRGLASAVEQEPVLVR
jgi:Rrf2 family protein